MTGFVLTAAALAVLAAALLARPFWRHVSAGGAPLATDDVRTCAVQLAQLRELHRAGALTEEQYRQSTAVVQGKALAALSDPAAPEASARRPSSLLAASLALFIVAVAALGYAWLGSPASLALGPGSGASAMAAPASEGATDGSVAAPHPLVPEQVAAMVEQLSQRLKKEPDDADGWLMLARSLVVLGKHAQAVDAFKVVTRLHPDDAGVLADYADALAVAQGGRIDGEPTRLIEHALQVDAANTKALALAGTAAFDRHDYAGAVAYWEKLVQIAPDDSFAQQISGGIAEARQLGGMAAASAPAVAEGPRAAAPSSVSGTVSLAMSLQGRAAPDDTVFVFARDADGSRMPLAILRRQVRDLPLQFALDDDMAMSPSAKLSGVRRVVVGARISRSGNATPQSGDLEGSLEAVAVGATGLRVEINREVAK